MFKKTLLIAALALTATGVASASGFYAGLGVGASNLNSKDTAGAYSINTGKIGALGNLFAGYTVNFDNQMNLGIEAFAGANSAKIDASAGNSTLTEQLQYNYGVRFVPAYQVTADTDAHLIAGFVRGQFKFSDGSASVNKNANGFQFGLGTTTSVNSNFAVRGDVIYTGYKSIGSDTASSKFSTLDGVFSGEYKFG